ncbi:MAG: hypothetical protein Q9221_002063 [Calogaya cf. arnoldii]
MASLSSQITLTPKVSRRKKVSLSPVKTRHTPPQPRSASALAERSTYEALPEVSYAWKKLDFDEFTLWGDDGAFEQPTAEQLKTLQSYLGETFGLYDMMVSGPWLVLFCKKVPDVDQRPFTIAGTVAVWLSEDEEIPPELSLGEIGMGDEIEMDDKTINDLKPYQLPSTDTLASVARYFETALFITFYIAGLVIELPERSEEEFSEALRHLPNGIKRCVVALGYYNGVLATTEKMRVKTPNLKYIDGEVDDTNYIMHQDTKGCFFPGAMLSADSGNSISAGVLVQNDKDKKTRPTVAFHCWDKEYGNHTDDLGKAGVFKVTQGNLSSGTAVGYVDGSLGTSDIGLVQLNPGIEFRNQFLDINAEAKRLLRSSEIKWTDEFCIDGYVTGVQPMKSMGLRYRPGNPGREKDFVVPAGKEHSLPPEGHHLSLIQGIYATSAPVIKSRPAIRESVGGSAVVRYRKVGEGIVVDKGEIAGFMGYSDFRPKSMAGQLLCFCEVLDNMIDAGWKVVPIAEKRKAEKEIEEEES